MSKININFNSKNYNIDESTLAPTATEFKSHLSTVMTGSGAAIDFGGTTYNIDSTKLSAAMSDFVSHLGIVAGNGVKVIVNGVEYSVDSNKVSGAVANLETTFGNLASGSDNSELLAAGLYSPGAIALYEEGNIEAASAMLQTPWTDLLSEGVVHVENGAVYSNFDTDEWINASSDNLNGDLVLPNDGSITELGNSHEDDEGNLIEYLAFPGCENLTGIMIPNSVTNIGMWAFLDCTRLTSVVIPNSVTSIGYEVFVGCDNLVYNTYDNAYYLGNDSNPYLVLARAIDESIISCDINDNTKIICTLAFTSCTSLKSVTIPDSVTSIGEDAFTYCTSLTSIVIPDSVTSIGGYAFAYCPGLTSIVIGNSVESIGDYAFTECTGLTNITVSTDNAAYKSIDGNLYTKDGKTLIQYAIDKTDNSFTVPDSVTSIGDYAFEGCTGLASIVIPDSVKSIGDYAFYRCTELTSVVIGDSVTSIGDYAFEGCTGLASIVIPDSVTSIGESAFYVSDYLVYNRYDNAYYIGNDSNPYLVLVKAVDTSISSCNIHDNTKFIYERAFEKCAGLTGIVIPDSVTQIFYRAFNNCTGLTSVVIPNGVTSIDNGAFYKCTGLTSIEISDGVTHIGSFAFEGCSSLTSIEIPNSVTYLCGTSFRNCSRLTNIVFKGSIEQWNSIFEEDEFSVGLPATYVQCTDGQAAL